MSIKVAIVEDDKELRGHLTALLKGSSSLCCVGAYANAEAALEQLPRAWPDVVLMDINLPQMSGIECAAKLKELRPVLQILMLTVYMDSDLIFKSLAAGASGYLVKRAEPEEILAAIADVHQGGAPMSSAIARKVVDYFQHKNYGPPETVLTRREQEILEQFSRGYRDKEIADRLSISLPTVRTHARNIYEKLHVRSRAEAVAKFLKGG